MEANAGVNHRAAGSARQIPITRVTAENNGDPNNILTPIYPTSPGKELPSKPAIMTKASADQKPAETDGRAAADDVSMSSAKAAALAMAPASAASNACNIPACESAYRSFRPEDCSYQPYDGPRRLCEIGNDSAAQAAISPSRNLATAVPALASARDDVEWRAVAHQVRQVPKATPMPEADDVSGDDWRGGYGDGPPPHVYYRRRGYWIDGR
ncbi:MAG: hypothetical protein B7Y70_16530 [Rhizobiales bacterium 35-68-8]|nr:MAG: hypothetical protein B7Y70_16530 [Rhizobiales bacterium 35-68-8]